jgi:hypothetical protein
MSIYQLGILNMNIKLIKLLDVLCVSVTSASNVLSHIRNNFTEVVNEDVNVFQLEASNYLMLSYPLDTLRKLIGFLPDQLVTEDMKANTEELYLYNAGMDGSDELYNLTTINDAVHQLHCELHRCLREGQDSIKLYS